MSKSSSVNIDLNALMKLLRDRDPHELRAHTKHTKKELNERVIHDEEYGEQDVELVDEEWAEFEKVLRQFRERRMLNASVENLHQRPKRSRKLKTQTFYPCPPPAEADNDYSSSDSDESRDRSTDKDGFMTTLVS
jgi:hypothetical protein